jgi:hypothetical protein
MAILDPLVLDSFVGPFSINFSIFIHFFAYPSLLVFDLEGPSKACFGLFSHWPCRTFVDLSLLELTLAHLAIIGEPYANVFQLDDK